MAKITYFAGHGNGDSGASYNGTTEHAEMLAYCKELKNDMDKRYTNVQTEVIIEGNFKTGNINYKNVKNDFGYTAHMNAFTSSSANGSEMYKTNVRKTAGNFAKNVLDFMTSLGFTNRGLKPEPFELYNLRNGGDFYHETCFISNKKDLDLWRKNRSKIVVKVNDEIAKYLGLKKKQPTQNPVYRNIAKIKYDLRGSRFDQNKKDWYLMEFDYPTEVWTDFECTKKDTAPNFKKGDLQVSYPAGRNKRGHQIHAFISNNGRTYYFYYLYKTN